VVTGQVVDSDPEAIVAGTRVAAVFRRLGQDGEAGVIYYGTKWQVAKAAKAAAAPKAEEAEPAKKKRSFGRRAKA
jgi:hypothetical protein